MKRTLLLGIVVVVLILTGVFLLLTNRDEMVSRISPSPSSSPDDTLMPTVDPALANLIKAESPQPGQLIKSPVTVKGEARGYWYFEASFPVKVVDADGVELGVGIAQAKSEWMTEDFVPFEFNLSFAKPSTQTGSIILEKDNPSGLPENDNKLVIPVRFDLDNWAAAPKPGTSAKQCKPTGCSGQICSDEDVSTTCEYKEEYACYKTAKCERQDSGECGWTPTEELVSCLYNAWGSQ